MARIDRLISVIKREVGDILLKKLPHKNLGIISILSINLSPNLQDAWIYYSHLSPNQDRASIQKSLESANGFIRSELGKALFTKKIPKLHFVYDERIEKTQELLKKIDALSNS